MVGAWTTGVGEQIIDAIQSVLVVLDESEAVVFWNQAACRVFRVADTQAVGKRFEALQIDWDWDVVGAIVASCRTTGEPQRSPDMVLRSHGDGEDRLVGFSVSCLRNASGAIDGFLFIGADITDRRKLESQLHQTHKLESIGQLASGIAHELNTPVQYVSSNLTFLRDSWGPVVELLRTIPGVVNLLAESGDERVQQAALRLRTLAEQADAEYCAEEVPRAIDQSLEGMSYAASVIAAMKAFAQSDSAEMQPTDLNLALKNAAAVARHEWAEVAEVVFDLDATLSLVPCFPGGMNQVFLNLITNASHAVCESHQPGTKGTITLRTKRQEDSVEIRVTDTGPGIPVPIQHRVFDPFFTTKAVGKGTGQGLSVARNVVDRHGGAITFETSSCGTTFIVRIPMPA